MGQHPHIPPDDPEIATIGAAAGQAMMISMGLMAAYAVLMLWEALTPEPSTPRFVLVLLLFVLSVRAAIYARSISRQADRRRMASAMAVPYRAPRGSWR